MAISTANVGKLLSVMNGSNESVIRSLVSCALPYVAQRLCCRAGIDVRLG